MIKATRNQIGNCKKRIPNKHQACSMYTLQHIIGASWEDNNE